MNNRTIWLSIFYTFIHLLFSSVALSQDYKVVRQRGAMMAKQESRPSQPETVKPEIKFPEVKPLMDPHRSLLFRNLQEKLNRSQFMKLEGVNDLGGGEIVEVETVVFLKHFRRILALHLVSFEEQAVFTKNQLEQAIALTEYKDREPISVSSFSDIKGPFFRLKRHNNQTFLEVNEHLWWRTCFEERQKYIFAAFVEVLIGSQKAKDHLLNQLFPIFSMLKLQFQRFDFIEKDRVKVNLDVGNIQTLNIARGEGGAINILISDVNRSIYRKVDLNSKHPIFSIFNEDHLPKENRSDVFLGSAISLSLFKKSILDCENKVRNNSLPKTIWTLKSSDLVVLCLF